MNYNAYNLSLFQNIKNLESIKTLSILGLGLIAAHLIIGSNSSIFRDEFYYIACANHPDFGYVDQPPLCAIVLGIWKTIFGDSLISIRILPSLTHALLMLVTALIVSEMGGSKFAQILAALCVLFAPGYLGVSSFYSMNSFDLLFWAFLFYIFVRIINDDNSKLWIWFGAIAGVGLMNKISVLFLLAGIIPAMLLVPQRKYFKDKYFWLGMLLAILIFFPYILWNYMHNFATLEFMSNAANLKNAVIPLPAFIFSQLVEMNPFIAIVWITGLVTFLTSKQLRKYKIFAFAYIIIFLIFAFQKGKPYYLFPYYTVLISAGAVSITAFAEKKLYFINYIAAGLVIISGIIFSPLAIPVLPPESLIAYQDIIGIKPPAGEKGKQAQLPQHLADRYGWEELTAKVAGIYNSLSDSEKSRTGIYAQNYGEAGAIDYYGRKYDLPKAICGHNNYWLWGYGNEYTSNFIIIGGDIEKHMEEFEEVYIAAVHTNKYAMPFENNLTIYIARGLKKPMREVWQGLKFYI
jgi:hypothetical protein